MYIIKKHQTSGRRLGFPMVTIHMEVVMTTTPQTETQINCITEQKKEENEKSE